MDVADEWRKLTGLPAVFAVWAGRQITPDMVEILQDARRRGMAKLADIAREEAPKLGLPFDLCHNYLSRVMIYELGEREMLGLKTFKDKATAHGLIESSLEATRT